MRLLYSGRSLQCFNALRGCTSRFPPSGLDSSSSKSRQNSGGGGTACFSACCAGRPCCAGLGGHSAGLASDVSSIPESGQTTDIGCEGDISESDDCANWLEEFDVALPCLPKFWLIMAVDERSVSTYFHCRSLNHNELHYIFCFLVSPSILYDYF